MLPLPRQKVIPTLMPLPLPLELGKAFGQNNVLVVFNLPISSSLIHLKKRSTLHATAPDRLRMLHLVIVSWASLITHA